MNLQSVAARAGIEVVRDGGFESLGLLSYDTPAMLVFLEDEQYLPQLLENQHVSAVVARPGLADRVPKRVALGLSPEPRRAFFALHRELASGDFYGKRFPTEIAKSARVHPRAFVAEHNVRIGEHCVVEPNATIMENSILADGVIVRAGAVIGSEGFQFSSVGGQMLSVTHAGGVRLERGVEVQSNACVDRAVFGGFTVVGEDTKIDNLVHIAHNVRLGKRNRVVAGAMVGGSVRTGNDVWVGPMASISSEITVGDGAFITLGAVVTRDVLAGERVTGNFAIDHEKFIRFLKSIR